MRRAWLLAALLPGLSASADTWRCGSQLVSVGAPAYEVEEKCGPPLQRTPVGYSIGPDGQRQFLLEQWLYPKQNGVYSLLHFEGNRLVRIERQR